MALTVSITGGSNKPFELIEEMIQPGVIADVVDLGEVTSTYAGQTKTQKKVRIVWIVAEEDSEGRNKRVFQRFTQSLHEKAGLRKFLATLGFKDFPNGSFDIEQIIGIKRMLVLSKEDGANGQTYTNVTGTSALPKGNPGVDIPKDFVRAQDKVPF